MASCIIINYTLKLPEENWILSLKMIFYLETHKKYRRNLLPIDANYSKENASSCILMGWNVLLYRNACDLTGPMENNKTIPVWTANF